VRLIGAAETLEGLIADARAHLRDYQDEALAQRYESLVRRALACEQERTGTVGELTEAVARGYAKLLAVKDEYEVARLLSGERLREQLAAQFEGEYTIAYNLAPPLLGGRDPATGRYRKREFGAWMGRVFPLLARLRVLRGTPLDVFGWSEHRRRERALVRWYEETLEAVFAALSPQNHATAVALARLPERIRGFDVVKEASMEAAFATREELLQRLEAPPEARTAEAAGA
jgi:indolepyruvate ferredoxin oxidoreductase